MTSPKCELKLMKCPECGCEMYYSEAFLCYVCTNDNCVKSVRFINEEESRKAYNKHLQGRIKNEPQQFQPGDVVRLKSGGLDMTVGYLNNEPSERFVVCDWHDDRGRPHRNKYPFEVLEKALQL